MNDVMIASVIITPNPAKINEVLTIKVTVLTSEELKKQNEIYANEIYSGEVQS